MRVDIADKEIRLLKTALKESIMKEINKLNLRRDQLAEKLDLLPSGVDILLSHSYWPFEKALSIIKMLDLSIELVISKK